MAADEQVSDAWTEPQARFRRMPILAGICLVALVAGMFFFLSSQATDTPARVGAGAGRLTLAEDDGQTMAFVNRATSPELWYRVTLRNAPVDAQLALTCEWRDPAGKLVLRNRYTTRVITKDNWPTHARHKLTAAAAPGTWTVKLVLDGRVLDTLRFEVGDDTLPVPMRND